MDEGDFGWALAKMRDGYKVRRRAWPVGRHIAEGETERMMPYDLHFVENDNVPVRVLSTVAILAQDWELHLD